jgi:DnaJ-class molecular chaperone
MNDILKEKVKRLGELYGILGVSQQAEQKEIRMAYKKMALTLHPDKNSSRESIDMFCRLNDAYSILRD